MKKALYLLLTVVFVLLFCISVGYKAVRLLETHPNGDIYVVIGGALFLAVIGLFLYKVLSPDKDDTYIQG